MPEGRITPNNGSFEYEYHLKDHLGSMRVAFNPGTPNTVVQTLAYYPFGATIAELSNNGTSDNRYGYNGKEQIKDFGFGQYDYSARIYNPLTGRWGVIDLMWWKKAWMSPYAYCLNNPLRYLDPSGWDEIPQNVFGPGTRYDPQSDVVVLNEITITAKKKEREVPVWVELYAWMLKFDEVKGGYHLYKTSGYDGTPAIRHSGNGRYELVSVDGMDAMFNFPGNWSQGFGPVADMVSAISRLFDAAGEAKEVVENNVYRSESSNSTEKQKKRETLYKTEYVINGADTIKRTFPFMNSSGRIKYLPGDTIQRTDTYTTGRIEITSYPTRDQR